MGSTSMYRAPGQTDRAFWEHELPTTLRQRGEILACATVSNTFYAAVRDKATGTVWALVCLQQRGRGDFNFTYKEMDETMGPAEDRCPTAILNLLTPLPEGDKSYAAEWRARCQAYQDARTSRAKVKKGDLVRFEHPLNFGNGDTLTELTFESHSTFRVGNLRYRIPRWRDRKYEVITA